MTTTTMHLSGQRIRGGVASRRQRSTVSRPFVDVAPWIAPMLWMAAVALIVAGAGALALARGGVPSGASATIAVRVGVGLFGSRFFTVASASAASSTSGSNRIANPARPDSTSKVDAPTRAEPSAPPCT